MIKERARKIFMVVLAERTLFKAALIAIMLLAAVPWLHYKLAPVYRIFLIWGAGIVITDLCTKRSLFAGKSLFLLLAFCGFYLITIFINRDIDFVKNLKALAYMAMVFVVLYGGDKRAEEVRQKEHRILTTELFVIFFAMAIFCLVTCLFSINYKYKLGDGSIGYIGMRDGRLAGLFNSNVGGEIFAIAVLLDIGILFKKKRLGIAGKITVIVQMILCIVCMYLSYSRTSIYALSFVLAVGTFWLLPLVWKSLKNNSFKTVVMARITAALVVLFMLVNFISPVRSVLYNVNGVFSSKKTGTIKETTAAKPGKTESDRDKLSLTNFGDLDGVLTGRLSLWKASVQVFEENASFGITHEAIPERLWDILDGTGWGVHLEGGGAHNTYISVLLSSGIAGTVCMVLFVIYIGIVAISRRKKWAHLKSVTVPIVISSLLLLMMLIIDLMETRILYRMGFFMVAFWTAAGILKEEIMPTAEETAEIIEKRKKILESQQ